MEPAERENTFKRVRPELAPKSTAQVSRVMQLFEQWLQDSSGYDEDTWPELKQALSDNHSESHKLFDA